MENTEIRRMARVAGIPLWRVAAAIGISEPTLTRWLRFPLPAEKENRVIEAISRLERPANKSQVDISGFGSSEKGNTKSSR